MSVNERLTQILRNVFGDDSLVATDDLRSTSRDDWDSIANLNLMFAVEQEFDITFQSSEFSKLADIGELRQAIERKARGP